MSVAHVNAQARGVFRDRLEALNRFATVETNLGPDLEDVALPAAVILTRTDGVEQASKPYAGAASLEKRMVTVIVVVIQEGWPIGLDDVADEDRAAIEAAIAVDEDLGGLAQRVQHTGADLDVGEAEDGARWYGFLSLSWEVEIWTHRGNPEVAV